MDIDELQNEEESLKEADDLLDKSGGFHRDSAPRRAVRKKLAAVQNKILDKRQQELGLNSDRQTEIT